MDFQTLVLKSWKRNQFLVSPDNYCDARPHMVSPVFELSVADLRERWMALIAAQPRMETRQADDEAMQYEFIQRTKYMRFPDIITVRFIPLEQARSTLAVFSRSRYGRRDFGVNKKRVRSWLDALTTNSNLHP